MGLPPPFSLPISPPHNYTVCSRNHTGNQASAATASRQMHAVTLTMAAAYLILLAYENDNP